MLLRRLRYWLTSAKRAAALRAEMELHIEEKIAQLLESGMSESDARAEARRRFGNLGGKQEQSREIWIARYWWDFLQDLRYGARTLFANKGFTFAAVVALVLGIGVNAVVFNVYNSLAWEPWAIRDPHEAVQVLSERTSRRWSGFSWPHFRYLQANTQSLAGLAADIGISARISQGDTVWDAEVGAVSANFFDVIGTGFAVGRGFSLASGSLKDPAPEIVMHYDTWKNRYGGDPALVGTWIDMNGQRLQVVGVTAPGFEGATITHTAMWVGAAWRDLFNPGDQTVTNNDSCCVSVVGRLKPGISRASAQAELNTLSTQFQTSISRPVRRVLLTDPSFLANPSSAAVSSVFLAIALASSMILLLACANIANLQLARATARRREIALRISLGASRGRVLRQLLAESLWISALAGTASLAVSAWLPAWAFRKIAGSGENLTFAFANDARVLAFTLFATFLAALLFGLAPALSAVRGATATGLREGSRATSTGRVRSILLAVQVALCAILLSGTALLVRSLDRLRHVDTGIQYENVLVMNTGLANAGLTDDQARGLLATLTERIAGLPGVESVALADRIPFGNQSSVTISDPRTNERVSVTYNDVSPNFFETLRVPLLAGRSFSRADEGSRTVIVSDATAQRFWPGENPLGKALPLGPPAEVIGVVRNFGAREPGSEQVASLVMASAGSRDSFLLVRHSGNAAALAAELPKRAREIDRRFLASVAPYSDTISESFRGANISAAIASVLGGLSLLLACVGIYGVAAYNVSQRTREVGVRMALGALPRSILAMVLKQNLWTVLIGAALGIAGALAFGRLLTSLLYGVEPTDPLALLVTIAILFTTSALAALGPARRASRVDPAITLRHE